MFELRAPDGQQVEVIRVDPKRFAASFAQGAQGDGKAFVAAIVVE